MKLYKSKICPGCNGEGEVKDSKVGKHPCLRCFSIGTGQLYEEIDPPQDMQLIQEKAGAWDLYWASYNPTGLDSRPQLNEKIRRKFLAKAQKGEKK